MQLRVKARGPRVVLAVTVFTLLDAVSILAATRTWTGANANWDSPSSWNPAGIFPGDDLFFGVAPIRDTVQDMDRIPEFNSITITAPNYTFSGSPIGLTQFLTLESGSRSALFDLPIDFNTTVAMNTDSAATLRIAGPLRGSGLLQVKGPGTVRLEGPLKNTSTGTTSVEAGVLELAKSAFDGALAGTLVIGDAIGGAGADVVRLLSSENIAGTVIINSTGLLDLNGFEETIPLLSGFEGLVQLGLFGSLTVGPGSSDSEFSGVIDGLVGEFHKTGPTTLRLSGSESNTCVCTTFVEGGTLELAKQSGAHAISGHLVIGRNSGPSNEAIVRLAGNNTDSIMDGNDLDLRATGRFELNDRTESVGSLRGAGELDLGSGVLEVGSNGLSTTFQGRVSGLGILRKVGEGTFTHNATTTHASTELVEGGLVIDGRQSITEVLVSGGEFEGTGIIGFLHTSAGVVSPGPEGQPGVLTVEGDAILRSRFRADLSGLDPADGNDQLIVEGLLDLTQSTLEITTVQRPPFNAQLTILDNDLSDAVSGTFTGLSEGGVIIHSGVSYRISYVGGTGNDVTLTVIQLSGDLNGDGPVDILDVFYLIAFLFHSGPSPVNDADLTQDGSVNVADVIYLLSFLFGGGPSPP